jgi:ATP-dependent RNA helicase DeaD
LPLNSLTRELVIDEDVSVSFAHLAIRPVTLDALTLMGITQPTPIQAAALPPLLDGQDLIGQARTGSGKTLAFGIPAIETIDAARRVLQVLVLTPTRELAVQVGGVLEQIGNPRGVRVGLVFGGRALGPQRDMLRRGVHVVVGTPGRVLDLLRQNALRLDQVRFLVLDEADQMLDQGFGPDVERIIARTPKARQTALFSATMPDWVTQASHEHLHHPVSVSVDPSPADVAPVEHIAYDLPDGDKLCALRSLLDHRGAGSVIVFGRTKHGVKKLAKQLQQAGYPVAALQGNLSQNARDRVMEDFRSGRVPILLATNVAARGLDVTHVDQVINFELPESADLLTHRIGRTGRMGRRGQAVTLLSPADGVKWRQLERGLGRRISRARWTGSGRLSAEVVPVRGAGAQSESGRDTSRSRVSQTGPAGRRWHPIVCSECRRPAEVPFQPDPARRVYCMDCFRSGESKKRMTGGAP